MFKDILEKSGLNANEALVYDFLLKKGEIKAGDIIKNTPLKRGTVYNALAGLLEKDLISEKKKQKIAYFSPNHPEKLREFIDNNELAIKKAKKELEANITSIISSFNLVSGKPGVRVFEGRNGLVKVLNDSLSSKTDILTYADIFGMEKYLGRDNDKYVQKRKELNIKKRGIVADTPYARQYLKDYDQSVTEIRFVDSEKYPLFLEMEIYDNKISFMTFSDKQLIGVIIENEEIYKTQRSIFELVWQNAKKFNEIIK